MGERTIYYISEAAKKVKVENHVLRYWEEELQLPIKRNEMGHRYYTEQDVKQLQEIKLLKEQGLQLKAIRTVLFRMPDLRMDQKNAGDGGELLPEDVYVTEAETAGTTEAESSAEIARKTEAESSVEAERKAETGSNIEIAREIGAGSNIEAAGTIGAGSNTEIARKTEAESSAETARKIEVEGNTEIVRKTEAGSKIETARRTDAGSSAEIASEADPARRREAGSNIEAARTTEAENNRASEADPARKTGAAGNIDAEETGADRLMRMVKERMEAEAAGSIAARTNAVHGDTTALSADRNGTETVLEQKQGYADTEKAQKAARLQYLLQHMITEAVRSANRELCTEVKDSILKELDYQFRMQEERDDEHWKQEEEHYRRIDEMIRERHKPREKLGKGRKKQ